jgi:HlyD family secretion protein
MKKKRLWLIIGLIISAIFLLIILKSTGVIGGPKGMKVAVEAAQERTITETVNASGKIYPETEVKIKADVSGEIVALPVQEGDSVTKGQLLIKINPSIYHSEVTQAEASMNQTEASVDNARQLAAQAKAQLDRAEANYVRNQKLYKAKVISSMEFEQLKSDYLTAKASYQAAVSNITGGKYSVAGAEAGLSQARENLRRTTITAPTTGIISQLLVKYGERVVGTQQMDGTQVMTIANLGRMEVQVDVSETDITKVSIGDTTLIEVDAYRNKKFTGVVSKISVSSVALNSSASLGASTTSSDQVTNYTVHIFILPQSYQALRNEHCKGKFPFKPGMSAGVEIQTRKENHILSIPINAVTTRDKPDQEDNPKKTTTPGLPQNDEIRQVVFVFHPETKKVQIRDVQTGIQDNENIQITKGLKKGEKVVIAPYGTIARLLQDKSNVEPVDKDKLYESEEKE